MPSKDDAVKVVASVTGQMLATAVKKGTTGDHRNWTMDFEIDHGSVPMVLNLIGDRSFGFNFGGSTLGEGITVKVCGTRRDSENVPRSKIQIEVPEWGGPGGKSQIDSFAGRAATLVGEGGLLEFTELQMAFDLTMKAE